MKVVSCVCLCYFLCLGFVGTNSRRLNSEEYYDYDDGLLNSEEYYDYDDSFFRTNSRRLNSEEYYHYDDSFFTLPNFSDVQHARIGAKKCMKELGCFEITQDFYDFVNRPINFLPHDRASINTQFKLYTKSHPMEVHYLNIDDPEEIKKESHIDPRHKTIFIVHGFFDNTMYGKWMENLKTHLLLYGDYNVIIVDWSKGNGAPYTQAAANSRVVGAEIALLIQTLQKHVRISPADCHIIGHSLGSHVAGYAGERLEKLGRITALDPAQPYFQNMPPSVRLDPLDADFVDVIHTDSSSRKFLALGMSQAVGHVDFYPNNGMNQPGCKYSSIYSIFLEGLFDAVRQFVSCNHQRAVEYFLYSLNFKKTQPVGHFCKNWNDYQDGRCSDCGKNGEKCAIMGMKADQYKGFKNDSQPVKMYLATAGSAPYWVYSYMITIKLAKPEVFKDRSGDIILIFQGSKSDYNIKLSTKTGELVHGATYSFLTNQQKELGELRGLKFKWIKASWNIFTKPAIYLDFIKITPVYLIDKEAREENSKKFCYNTTKAIESKLDILLYDCI